MKIYDAVFIGAGFYGCSIALELKKKFKNILIIEKEDKIMSRASSINQGRIHNGYHYPRHFKTAYSSHVNFNRFIKEYKSCVINNFTSLYAIPKELSQINANQFKKMFRALNAPIKTASSMYKYYFNKNLIEEIFEVEEYTYDYLKLRKIILHKLTKENISLDFNKNVFSIVQGLKDCIELTVNDGEKILSHRVFNCSYAGVNELMSNSQLKPLPLKFELAEIALIKMPEELQKIGITVMDGPFFSTLPYFKNKMHTLTHVRYTPHCNWVNKNDNYIFDKNSLKNEKINSKYLFMLKDAERYIPLFSKASYVKSLFEIKTLLLKNEKNDGRPIVYKKNYGLNNHYIILGGKIDNIYDIQEKVSKINY